VAHSALTNGISTAAARLSHFAISNARIVDVVMCGQTLTLNNLMQRAAPLVTEGVSFTPT
jgi:N-methylhydantoinase A/oxoprolinase/acetone carboxylase beta subunit